MNNELSALDILTIIISFISVQNYVENEEQSASLKALANDIKIKTEEQTKILNEILDKIKRLEEK